MCLFYFYKTFLCVCVSDYKWLGKSFNYMVNIVSHNYHWYFFYCIAMHLTSKLLFISQTSHLDSWLLIKWIWFWGTKNYHFVSSVSVHHRPLLHFLLVNIGGIWKCFSHHGDREGLHYLRYDDGLWVAWWCTPPLVCVVSGTSIERL